MKIHSRLIAVFAASALSCSLIAFAQAPDNTKQNKTQSPTAENQSNATSDRLTTANVRKAIIADKNLSMYAHNVKIITSDSQVILKGPVKSDEEKQQVFKDATSVVSADKVVNQLTVKQ